MNDRQATDIASALATVQRMHDELETAHETIGQLKADLRAEQNKSTLFDEERRMWRADANVLRTKLIELATIQSQLGLIARKADEVTASAQTLLTGETEAGVLNNLERSLSPSLPVVRYDERDDDTPAPGRDGPVEDLQTLARVAAGECDVVLPEGKQ